MHIFTYNMFSDETDRAIQENLGERLRKERLNRNIRQTQLAEAAGLSPKTVVNLENGKGGTLLTLIAYLRAMDLLDRLDAIFPAPAASPLQLAKLLGQQRQRASRKNRISVPKKGE